MKRSLMWPLAWPHSGGNIAGACRPLGARDATVRLWHTSSKSHSPPTGRYVQVVFEHTERAWQYWLSRRSHTGHINWQKYEDAVRHQLPLPKPRIIHNI
jgi:hypothetical protein